MCFAPQRRALFWQVNFQKRSDTEVLYTFWLQNVLRATTTCTFSTSQFLPREPGTWKTVGPVKTAGVLQQKHEGCLKGIPPSTYLRIIKVLFRHPLSSTKNYSKNSMRYFIYLIFHHRLHLPNHIHWNPQEAIYHSWHPCNLRKESWRRQLWGRKSWIQLFGASLSCKSGLNTRHRATRNQSPEPIFLLRLPTG